MALNVNQIQNQTQNIAEQNLEDLAVQGGVSQAPSGAPQIDSSFLGDPGPAPQEAPTGPLHGGYAGATPAAVLDSILATGADPNLFGPSVIGDLSAYQAALENPAGPPVDQVPNATAPQAAPGAPLTPIPARPENYLNPNETIIDPNTGQPLQGQALEQAQRDAFELNQQKLDQNGYADILRAANDIDAIGKALNWRDPNKKKSFANNMAFNQKTLLATPVVTTRNGVQEGSTGIGYLMGRSGRDAQQVALASEMSRIQVAKLIAPLDHAVKAKQSDNQIAGIYDDLSLGDDALVPFHTEEGTIGVEADSFERNLGSQYRSVIDQANQNPEGRLKADEAENRLLVDTLIKNGDIVEDMHQPTNGAGVPVGDPVRAFFIRPKLMQDYNQFRELSDIPSVRIGATKATGVDNKHIGPLSNFAKGDTKRPTGEQRQEIKEQSKSSSNPFNVFSNTMRNAGRKYDNNVLTTDALLVNSLAKLDKQIQSNQGTVEELLSPTELAMLKLAEASLKLDKKLSLVNYTAADFEKMNNDPELMTKFQNILDTRNRKLKSVSKKIAEANALEQSMKGALHKLGSGVFSDPSNYRQYVFAYNSSEQNNPFIRGALAGYSLPISKNKWADTKDNTTPLLTPANLGNLRTLSKNGGKRTPATREQTFLLMLGRQILKNGKNLPDTEIIKRVNKNMVLTAAEMGRALKEFNASNPSADLLSDALGAEVQGQGTGTSEALARAFDLMGTEPKNKGSIEQMLIAASDYVDGDAKNTKITFTVFPDMNSAGRLNPVLAATGNLPADMLARMGMIIDQSIGQKHDYAHGVPMTEADSKSLAPFGNPRKFIADQLIENLESAERGGTLDTDLASFLKQLLDTDAGKGMIDKFIKNPVMVVDYGMMISGAAKMAKESFKKMVTSTPEVEAMYEEFVRGTNTDSAAVEESIRIHMGETLASTTNPQYSRSFQQLGLGAAVMGVPLVYEGYDGIVHTVGSVQRKPSGDTFIVDGDNGGVFHLSEAADDTSARAKTKPRAVYDKSGKIVRYELIAPPVYSGQIQAWSPMVGQVTERALIVKALAEMNKRFGKAHDNILLDMHDSIGMDFEDSFHYQNILQEILPDVLSQNLPGKGAVEIFNKMKAKHVELSKAGTVDVGPGSGLDSLHTFLDESYKHVTTTISNTDFESMDPSARSKYEGGMKRQLQLLHDAQKAGVWAPVMDRPIDVLGISFKPQPELREGPRNIDYKNDFFGKFFQKHFMDPAHKAAKKMAGEDTVARSKILKMLKDIDPARLSFFRNGNETGVGL